MQSPHFVQREGWMTGRGLNSVAFAMFDILPMSDNFGLADISGGFSVRLGRSCYASPRKRCGNIALLPMPSSCAQKAVHIGKRS
jgi:hypothetical protein